MKYWSFSCCFSSWCFSCRWRSSSSHMAASRATKHMWAQTRLKKTCACMFAGYQQGSENQTKRQNWIGSSTSPKTQCLSRLDVTVRIYTLGKQRRHRWHQLPLHADSKIKVHLRVWFLSCLCLAWKWGLRHLNLAQDTWGKLFAFLSCLKQQQS